MDLSSKIFKEATKKQQLKNLVDIRSTPHPVTVTNEGL